MESALIALVSIALVIISTLTIMTSSFQSVTIIADSWRQMEQQADSIRRTEIAAGLAGNYTGGNINLMVVNEGQTNLNQFSRWDIIAQYQTGDTNYIAYTENATPGSNQWRVEGIYLSDNTTIAEVFDPNILNPGETIKVIINLDPDIAEGETGRITISTFNGITSQCLVTRLAPS